MAMEANSENTIVVTRRVRVEVVVGGAVWKIAYADFVTAMMAFFLLLWLVSVLSQKQAEGVSDYFSKPVEEAVEAARVREFEGVTFDPDNVLNSLHAAPTEGEETPNFGGEREGLLEGEQRLSDEHILFSRARVEVTQEEIIKRLEWSTDNVGTQFNNTPRLRELLHSFMVEDTSEGVRIDLVDTDLVTIFENSESAEISEEGKRFLATIFTEIVGLPNLISIIGHAASDQEDQSERRYFELWQLSIARAAATQRWLNYLGFPLERLHRLEGRADTIPLRTSANREQSNNRISILILARPGVPGDFAVPLSKQGQEKDRTP